MYGIPVGLTSAVLNFNRLPTLHAAFARRVFALLCGAYFDDNIGVDVTVADKSGKAAMKQVFDASGSEFAPPKSMPGASRRVFLGVDSDLGPAVRIGFVNLDLKPFVRTDLFAYMHRNIASGSFSSSQASKLRGDLAGLLRLHMVSAAASGSSR